MEFDYFADDEVKSERDARFWRRRLLFDRCKRLHAYWREWWAKTTLAAADGGGGYGGMAAHVSSLSPREEHQVRRCRLNTSG